MRGLIRNTGFGRERYKALVEIGASLRQGFRLDYTLVNLETYIYKLEIKPLKKHLREGIPLVEAAKKCRFKFPRLFPPALFPYLRWGDKCGRLPLMFTLMEKDYLHELENDRNFWKTLSYPITLSILVGMVFLLSRIKIMPVFEKMNQDLGTYNVYATHGAFGDFIHWWILNLGWIALWLPPVLLVIYKLFPRLESFYLFHRIHEIIPFFGRAFHNHFWSKYARVCGSLLGEGSSVSESVEAAGAITGKRFLIKPTKRLVKRIQEGEPLSKALRAEKVFPESLIWAIAQGELTGNLPDSLINLAGRYGKVGNSLTSRSLQILEMALTAVIAFCTIMYIIGIYMNMFNIVLPDNLL